LQELPARIEALEIEQTTLAARMNDPEYFKRDARELRIDQGRTQVIESDLLELLERWDQLEKRAGEAGR
jgi:ATP-binding cassette subfamily F protein uup